jgi:lysozyme
MPIRDQIVKHEGLKLKPYKDSVGKLTIGVGRNLDDVGISFEEAMSLLDHDLARVQAELDSALPWWRTLDPVRQNVMIDLGFNLGVLTPVGQAKLLTFTQTLTLIQTGKYTEAADHLTHLPWHTQVGQRALDLEQMLRTGIQS